MYYMQSLIIKKEKMIKETRKLYENVIPWMFLKFKSILWGLSFSTILSLPFVLAFLHFGVMEEVINAFDKTAHIWEILFSATLLLLAVLMATIPFFFSSYYISKKYIEFKKTNEFNIEIYDQVWIIASILIMTALAPFKLSFIGLLVFLWFFHKEIKNVLIDFKNYILPTLTWLWAISLCIILVAFFASMFYAMTNSFIIFLIMILAGLVIVMKEFINFLFSLIFKIEDESRQKSLIYYKIAKSALNWQITLKYVIMTLGFYLPWLILLFFIYVFNGNYPKIEAGLAITYFAFFAFYIEYIAVNFYQKYLKNNQK